MHKRPGCSLPLSEVAAKLAVVVSRWQCLPFVLSHHERQVATIVDEATEVLASSGNESSVFNRDWHMDLIAIATVALAPSSDLTVYRALP